MKNLGRFLLAVLFSFIFNACDSILKDFNPDNGNYVVGAKKQDYSQYRTFNVTDGVVRKINEKVEYIDESRNEIGLVTRLDYKNDFEFDCLQFSNLYYPLMNYMRLLVFFIPIGASYDFAYASFGGVIVSQLLYIMFSVSFSGFVKSRDSLVYPLCDFLFMILQLGNFLFYQSPHCHRTCRKRNAFRSECDCRKSVFQCALNHQHFHGMFIGR